MRHYGQRLGLEIIIPVAPAESRFPKRDPSSPHEIVGREENESANLINQFSCDRREDWKVSNKDCGLGPTSSRVAPTEVQYFNRFVLKSLQCSRPLFLV